VQQMCETVHRLRYLKQNRSCIKSNDFVDVSGMIDDDKVVSLRDE
jgi:hypothetical protein